MTGPRAAIDLGSNSALLLVVDGDGRALVDEARVVGLGRGLGDGGALRPDRADAALATLAAYATTAAAHGVSPGDVRVVGTSALRRATDAVAFAARLRRETGLRLAVIDGADEARLTRAGALSDRGLVPAGAAEVLVVDVGGGSTELSTGGPDGLRASASLEVGTVRATESWLGLGRHDPDGLARLRAALDDLLASSPVPRPDVVVGVAGTVTTIAAHLAGVPVESAAAVHGARLTRDDLAAVVADFLPRSPAGRRARLAVAPERADYVVAGAAIVERVLAHAGVGTLIVSARDLRHGVLADASGAVTSATPRV